MTKLLQVGNDIFEYPQQGTGQGHGEDATAWAEAVTDTLKVLFGPNDILLNSDEIDNNTTSDIRGLIFDPSKVRHTNVEFAAIRRYQKELNQIASEFGIFVATTEGISISNDKGTVFTNSVTGMESTNIVDVQVDSSGNIYLATKAGFDVVTGFEKGGLSISTDGGNSFNNFDASNGLINSVLSIHIDKSGTILLGTTNGLFISNLGGLTTSSINDLSFRNYTSDHGLPSLSINDVFVDSDGYVYVGSNNGLSRSELTVDNFPDPSPPLTLFIDNYTTSDGLGDNEVRSLYIDSSDQIYVATSAGLSITDRTLLDDVGVMTPFTNKTPDPSNTSLKSVYVTDSGTIYVGTLTGRVQVSVDGFDSLSKNVSLGNSVNGIYVDSTGVIYASTSNGLEISTDGGDNFVKKTTSNGLGDNFTNSVYFSKTSNVDDVSDTITINNHNLTDNQIVRIVSEEGLLPNLQENTDYKVVFVDINNIQLKDENDIVIDLNTNIGKFTVREQDFTVLVESGSIYGNYNGSDFRISIETVGDDVGLDIDIQSSGQFEYTSSYLPNQDYGQIFFKAKTIDNPTT